MQQFHRYAAILATGLTLLFTATVAAEEGLRRTASGRPDLSGTYDGATLTPLVRPAQFGDTTYLTREEADKLAEEEWLNVEKNSQSSDPDRLAPPEGGDGSPGAGGNVGGYNRFWIDPGTKAFSVDAKFPTSIIIDPHNGQFPPMTPEGQKALAALLGRHPIIAHGNDGTAWWIDKEGPGPYDNMEQLHISERCILGFSGAAPPIPGMYNNFKRIVQTDDYVMILIEMVHDARIVRMNSEHLGPQIKHWLGDSVGWWESDTLVVDTTNYSPKGMELRAPSGGLIGNIVGASTHVVERFSRLDNGDLLYNFTVEDDTMWEAPWTSEYVWRASDEKVYEYACHEGNYAIGNIMRGARLLEKEALKAKKSGGSDDATTPTND